MTALRLSFVFSAAVLVCAQNQTGEWTLSRSDVAGKVHFSMESASDGHSFSNSSDWNVSDLQGLDLATPGKHDVHFTITRDAGAIDAEGFARESDGAGLYTFRPNPQYSREMESLGFPGVTSERQLAFALHDVSLAYARAMKGAGIDGLDARKLIAFRIHKVTPEYVKELERLGFPHPDPERLIALRIHRVTPEYIEKLRAHGVQNVTLDQLIALRIHGIE